MAYLLMTLIGDLIGNFMIDLYQPLNDEKWDGRYLRLAKDISSWSKDPSTKVGAVVIGNKGQVLSQGYNGFPRGIHDTTERLDDRATKYKFIVHAEMNAIYNATYNGVSLDGSTLYVSGLPVCLECAKGVIQVGIKKVVTAKMEVPEKWQESCKEAKELLEEAGVKVETS